MQTELDSFLERLAQSERGKKQPDEDIPDNPVYLHYPLEYVLRTWLDHRASGTYPEAGGYNQQDAQLMDDWAALNERYFEINLDLDAREAMHDDTPEDAPYWRNLA